MSNLISFYTIMGLLLNIVSISWFLQAWEISKSSVTFWDAISVRGDANVVWLLCLLY